MKSMRLMAALVAAPVLAAVVLAADGLTDEIQPSDVAIVLGSKVNPDGAPSARLAARLDRSLELYRSGMVRSVIVSGGIGKEGFDEAAAMKAYLVGKGIPPALIFMDSDGVNTQATARNSKTLMDAHGYSSAIAVTQYFHIPRTRLALQRAGVKKVGTAHAYYFEPRDAYSLAREVVGYPAYLVR